MAKKHYVIVGAGLAGAVLARELVGRLPCQITILEGKTHIGGHCYTERDPATQILLHKYGPHIFNTNREDVWDYVNRFARFHPFVNRVKAKIDKGIFSFPINLHTINQFFGKAFNPSEAREFITSIADKTIGTPSNFEEQALQMIGHDLYGAFFYGYTKKQWGHEPRELPASLIKRIPIRFNYNDSYYDKAFQGIPEDGYTEMIRNILDHKRITVLLDTAFVSRGSVTDADHLFFTGPLDAYFDFKLGRLGYRTVEFERIDASGDLQGCAVLNFPGMEVPYTRIHEHKHFAPWEEHDKTVSFKEFSRETTARDLPYYPKRLPPDVELAEKYMALAASEQATSFLGRLGTYRYLNMDEVIAESLDFAALFTNCVTQKKVLPVFPRSEPELFG